MDRHEWVFLTCDFLVKEISVSHGSHPEPILVGPFLRIGMASLEETIKALTSTTPSGGCCTIGDSSFLVRYCSDSWEWEYRGNIYYDPQDLAEAILRKSGPSSRLVRFFTGRIPDQRRVSRT
jgi:hypothetical protein